MKIDAGTIEKYQLILEKDPHSQIFAALAEAYREMGLLNEARRAAMDGIKHHPNFTSGLVTLGKILRDLQEFEKAAEFLKKAISIAPENILAHQILAEIYLATKNPKEALKSFKMVLFLNPNSKSAQKAVQKLESLTADDYDEEVFEMSKLPEVTLQSRPSQEKNMDDMIVKPVSGQSSDKGMERILSLIDAFIVRNDLEKAHSLLTDGIHEFGEHPELARRLNSLQGRYQNSEDAIPLKPLEPRAQVIRERKLEILQMMLRNIENYRSHG